jgi:hypothetical protein
MAISSAPRDYRTLIAAASLVAGPLLMAIGDLLHPEERMAPAEQIAILVDQASRWYTAPAPLRRDDALHSRPPRALGPHRSPQASRRVCGTYPYTGGDGSRRLDLCGRDAGRPVCVGRRGPGCGHRPTREHVLGTDTRRRWPGSACVFRRHGCLRSSADENRQQRRLGGCNHLTRRASCSRRDPLRSSHSQPNRQHSGLLRELKSRLADSSGCNGRDR